MANCQGHRVIRPAAWIYEGRSSRTLATRRQLETDHQSRRASTALAGHKTLSMSDRKLRAVFGRLRSAGSSSYARINDRLRHASGSSPWSAPAKLKIELSSLPKMLAVVIPQAHRALEYGELGLQQQRPRERSPSPAAALPEFRVSGFALLSSDIRQKTRVHSARAAMKRATPNRPI